MDESLNLTWEITYNRKPCLLKKYISLKRFETELKYIPIFKKAGFNVPKIEHIEKTKRQIIFEKIQGEKTEHLEKEKLVLCIGELAKIFKAFSDRQSQEAARKYPEKVFKNIILYAKNNSLVIEKELLKKLIDKLKKNFKSSVFKDAKPTNWIFQKKKVYLIDFDYVVPSFFLADLAQLLTYQRRWHSLDIKKYLNIFLVETISSAKTKNYLQSFTLAMINSNIMSQRYNPNLGKDTIKIFTEQNNELLRQLKIL
ncbi:MAG: phosphotransferase [Candidatus Pacebacteria bacterium]|nr:phosphotransferase [Candidatus Paceibacterota bacterium]